MNRTAQAGARLDRLPTSGFHRQLLWLIGAGMFLDSFDIYLAGGVIGELTRSGWSNLSLNAAFLSSTFVGMLLGAFAAGVLGDAKGRKFTYQFNLAIFGLASLAGALAPNMWFLIVCRFFMGLGLGAEIVIGYSSIGEFIPPKVRGRWSSYLSLITNSALFASTALGYLIIPSIGWRAMFAIVGIGALGVWLLRKNLPESPRWLEAKGRHAEADAILRQIEAASPALPPLPPSIELPPRQHGLGSLFRRPVLRRTLVAVWVQVAINVVIYGFIVWVPTFLVQQGLELKSSLGYTTLMSLGGPAGALAGVLLADRVGRKNGLIGVALLAALFGWLYSHSSGLPAATLWGFLLFTCTYLMVALGIASYIPELFPTENRMRGAGVASAAGRLAGIIAPQVVVLVYANGEVGNVLLVITGALLSMALVLWLFGTETNRRSLEAIASDAHIAPGSRAEAANHLHH
ncbi:MFS transporter [Pseudomonas sp. NPDC007930]|uniref:MFS transporter n=1 Tax=Pseudomonas sp. NPDC007930 TaxID=3364417 RepID=UPI0036EDB4EC